jgi:hypothetical protein
MSTDPIIYSYKDQRHLSLGLLARDNHCIAGATASVCRTATMPKASGIGMLRPKYKQ